MKDLESEKAEVLKVKEYNQNLTYELNNLRKEVDILKDIEDSAEKDRKDMEGEYEGQKKKIENMGLEKKELEGRLQNLKMDHKEEIKKWKMEYEAVTNELREDIKELQEEYEIKIREINSERNKLQEESREKKRFTNKGKEPSNKRIE